MLNEHSRPDVCAGMQIRVRDDSADQASDLFDGPADSGASAICSGSG